MMEKEIARWFETRAGQRRRAPLHEGAAFIARVVTIDRWCPTAGIVAPLQL
jgi:hypothetical protein